MLRAAMLLAALVGLVIAFIASMPVAGPVAALIVRHAVEGHPRPALAIAVGTGLAEGMYALAAMLGATLLEDFPIVIPISKCLAAVMLVVLGVIFTRFVPKTPGLAANRSDAPADGKRHGTLQSLDVQAVMKRSRFTELPWKSFTVGFSLTALNPTLLATWTAAATMIQGRAWFDINGGSSVTFALGVVSGAFLWFSVLVWLLSRYRHRFSPLTLQRVIRWMGVGLICLGTYFLVEFVVWIVNH